MPLKSKASSATKIYSIKSLTLLNSKANKAVENRTHPDWTHTLSRQAWSPVHKEVDDTSRPSDPIPLVLHI